jgi:hypothetical protein
VSPGLSLARLRELCCCVLGDECCPAACTCCCTGSLTASCSDFLLLDASAATSPRSGGAYVALQRALRRVWPTCCAAWRGCLLESLAAVPGSPPACGGGLRPVIDQKVAWQKHVFTIKTMSINRTADAGNNNAAGLIAAQVCTLTR